MHTIILAGGSGTRLFPLSREEFPKQFIKILGEWSLFQTTLRRALLFSMPNEVYIVTNKKQQFIAKEQADEVCSGCKIIVEPESKNTLPAIYYGLKKIIMHEMNPLVLILPSDHYIENVGAYIDAIGCGQRIDSKNIVTFGVVPSRPETEFGYIRCGTPVKYGYELAQFYEKPDKDLAKTYVDENYLWNSGMYMGRIPTIMEEIEKHAPELKAAFDSKYVDSAFAECPSISFDTGVMEKTSVGRVVVLDAGWDDMGSFQAIYDKTCGLDCECYAINSENNLVISDRLMVLVGVENMAIVDTSDVLLVCPIEKSNQVGEIAKLMKSIGDERAQKHTCVYRPWGSYTVLETEEKYKIKKLSIKPGQRISRQLHTKRSEHWVVIKGTANVLIG